MKDGIRSRTWAMPWSAPIPAATRTTAGRVMPPRSGRHIAKNTVEALQSGMVFGVAAQVEGLVARMITELGVMEEDVTVISTGHLAPLVVDDCACFTVHSPWLTLQGLRLVFERNS